MSHLVPVYFQSRPNLYFLDQLSHIARVVSSEKVSYKVRNPMMGSFSLSIHPSIWPGIYHLLSVFLQTRQKCMKTRRGHYYRESQNRHLFIISLSSASGEEKLQGVPLTHKKCCCAETRNLNKGCIRKSLVSTLTKSLRNRFISALFHVLCFMLSCSRLFCGFSLKPVERKYAHLWLIGMPLLSLTSA